MTDGSLVRHDKPMCVRIWLEVGHACEPRRSAMGRALALDWRVWVRGPSGRDISTFVHKVVFHLHPPSAFVYPKRDFYTFYLYVFRFSSKYPQEIPELADSVNYPIPSSLNGFKLLVEVLQEPPYEIQESGCVSIDIPVHVYLKHSTKPKKIRLRYSLHIESNAETSSESRCVYYDVENPSEQLRRSLMKGGGEIIAHTGNPNYIDEKLVVLSDEDRHKLNAMKTKKYKFVEPVQCRHGPKMGTKNLFDDICSKCGTSIDFRKLLRSVSMSEDEIERVSHLYLSYSSYEKSVDALLLPPLSDPIYRVPELPEPPAPDYTVQ